MSMELRIRFKTTLTRFHPRGREWTRFLDSFELDPDDLPRPVPEPSDRDFIICGAPRSGTTLLTAMLFQPPRVVTVMEPWSGMRLPPRELFSSIRKEIDETGRLCQGKLDVTELEARGEVRWAEEGAASYEIKAEPDYLLGIKWPAFWRYIELLPTTRFLVCIRDPKEVVSSLKRTGGRLGLGLDYDVAFDRRVNAELKKATRNLALRRVLLYMKINAHLLPHLGRSNVMAVRYERWFAEPDALMSEISRFLGTPLHRGHVKIRPPGMQSSLNKREMRLISENCGVMRELGYSI